MKWEISKDKITAVVTDGGTNITKAVKDTFGAQKHMECFAHKLNTVICHINNTNKEVKDVITKAKAIVTFFKQSTTAADELRRAQREADDGQIFRLVQDVPTRWNATYYMMCRFQLLTPMKGAILLKSRGSPLMLSPDDMAIVSDAIKVLKYAETLTRELSGAKYVKSSAKQRQGVP